MEGEHSITHMTQNGVNGDWAPCPVCSKRIPPYFVEQHIEECLMREDRAEVPDVPSNLEDMDREYAIRLMVEETEERRIREETNNRLLQDFLQNDTCSEPMDVCTEALSLCTCSICSEKHSLEQLHFLDCSHCACKKCMREMILRKIAEKRVSQVNCKECGIPVPTADIKALLSSDEDYSRYEAASMQELLETSNNTYKRCPNTKCNSILELMKSHSVPGKSNEVGLDGAPLSPEAIKHKQEYRFRCYECDTTFCAGCNTSPYHLGYTCEQQAQHCRFCNAQLTPKNICKDKKPIAAFVNLCDSSECKAKRDVSCNKVLRCGHLCGGIKNETACLKCLQIECLGPQPKQSSSDFCSICWIDELGQAPCIQLACGHFFHLECTKMKIRNKWAGIRITFGFLECALCKQMINHPALQEDLKPILELREQVKNKALQRLRYMEGDKKLPELNDPGSKWRNNPEAKTNRWSQQPYFGGERACEEERADFDPKELLCGGCSGVAGQEVCATHGKDFIEYKCKFCCSMSVFFCWGTTHFCDSCHKKAGSIARVPKEELPKCNCNVKHPPNEFNDR